MTNTRGRCGNVDYCELAATLMDIEVPLGAPFTCPECAKTLLQPPPDRPLGRATDVAALSVIVVGLVCLGLGAGYLLFGGAPPRQTAMASAEHPPPPVVIKPPVVLRVEGSALLATGLAPKLAAAFLTAQGDTGVAVQSGGAGETVVTGLRAGRPESVVVAASGSDAAFAALAGGRTAIAMASRRITAPEQARLHLSSSAASGHPVAMAVPAVIVNPRNAVGALTVETLSAVLDGSISTWMPLGGSVEPIHLLTTSEQAEASAGSPHPLSDAVMRDEDSIAVVSLPRAGGAKVLAIGAPGVQPTAPSADAVASMSYPLAHALYLYAPATPQNQLAQLFVNFALSPAGQAMVPAAGLVPLPPASPPSPQPARPASPPAAAAAPPPKPPEAAKPAAPVLVLAAPAVRPPVPVAPVANPQAAWSAYRSLPKTARLLNPGLHFQGDTDALDATSERDLQRALGLIAAAKAQPAHVVLASFASGRANPGEDMAASAAAAHAVAALLAKAGNAPGQVLALGAGSPERPVRGNRRWVEMYVLN